MADSESIAAEEQSLQKQIENIYLDYQKAVESMAPKDINTRKVGTGNNGDDVDDDGDLEGLLHILHQSQWSIIGPQYSMIHGTY